MRYTVKFYDGISIKNKLSTDSLSEAIAVETRLRKKYGFNNAWIADSLQELLVG